MLNKEQKKELEEMYSYTDTANISEDDIALGRIMFDTPEKFSLLRKMLQMFSKDERGLTIKTAQSVVQADIKDLQVYAIETAVNNLAEEKLKYMLYNFYRMLRNDIVTKKTKEYEDRAKKDLAEAEATKVFRENQEKEKRTLGKNL